VRELAPAQPRQREGLRLSTLVIAAIASGAAAVIVSTFWTRGTILASAMTPVVVALVSEMLRKPVESDLVRKPLRVARSAVTSNVPVTFDRGHRVDQPADEGAAAPDVRIYSTGSNRARTKPHRNLRLKVAIGTGLAAFAIAVAVLTLPELVFGGSVAGHRSTTYFGGKSSGSSSSSDTKSSDKSSSKDSTDSSSSSGSGKDSTDQSSSPNNQTTTGQSTTTAPDQTTPNQTTTQQQTPPQTTAPTTTTPPAPTTPTPTTPTP
jgi:hypothetical protein